MGEPGTIRLELPFPPTVNHMYIHLKRGVTVDDLMGGKPEEPQRRVDESEIQRLVEHAESRRLKTKSGRLRGRRTAEDVRREDEAAAKARS